MKTRLPFPYDVIQAPLFPLIRCTGSVYAALHVLCRFVPTESVFQKIPSILLILKIGNGDSTPIVRRNTYFKGVPSIDRCHVRSNLNVNPRVPSISTPFTICWSACLVFKYLSRWRGQCYCCAGVCLEATPPTCAMLCKLGVLGRTPLMFCTHKWSLRERLLEGSTTTSRAKPPLRHIPLMIYMLPYD